MITCLEKVSKLIWDVEIAGWLSALIDIAYFCRPLSKCPVHHAKPEKVSVAK